MKKEVSARLLNAISKFVNRMSADEIEEFILFLEKGAISPKRKSPRKSILKIEPSAADEILSELSQAKDRNEGRKILEKQKLNRKNLEILAARSNVHITKQDKIATIELKLVETLIGSRLNSRAIRGD